MSKRAGFNLAKLISENLLDLGDGQQMHYKLAGKPKGEPVVYLHGGPGAAGGLKHSRLFDSKKWFIIIPDQRGCGKSTPAGILEKNNITQLARDLEVLRKALELDKWTVAGGSWGTSLALKYSETYVEHVKGILLRAVFLTRPEDDDWMFSATGARRLYPEIWQKACELSELSFNQDIRPQLWKLNKSDKVSDRQRVAALLTNWEGAMMKVRPQIEFKHYSEFADWQINSAQIFFHYQENNYFLGDNELLANAKKLVNIPIEITHGRLDFACPVAQAFALKEALPHANLTVVPLAGHSSSEPPLLRATAAASERLYQQVAD